MMYSAQYRTLLWEVFLFFLLSFLLLAQISDNDIWYHLSIGREIFNTLSIPAYEFLVFPNADKPGSYHEWGFGLLHFLTYRAAGYWGMSIVNAVMAGGALYLLYRAANPKREDKPLFFVVAMAVLVWTEFRLIYRPEMVLYLAMAAETLLLERFLTHRHWKWLLPIPFLGFVLNQAHPSLIFMIVILGGYALQILWESRKAISAVTSPFAWMVLAGAATILLGALNPYGIEQIILPFKFLAAGRATITIEEFQNVLIAGYHWSYFSLLISSGLALVLAKNKRLVDVLFYLVFALLAFRYVRNIGLFALVMYVPLARGLSDTAARLTTWLGKVYPNFKEWWFQATAWTFALGALAAVLLTPIVLLPWGAGPSPMMFPETAVAAIKQIKPSGRIFNFYDLGGYLGWMLDGEYQVFIDGRHYDANRALSVHHAVISGRPGWHIPLERYSVNTIVIQGTFKQTGMMIPVVALLAEDPEWSLVSRGERALVFMRKNIASELPPKFRLNKREVWQQVLAEANYVLENAPSSQWAYLARGEALLNLGHRQLAIREFETYLDMAPGDADLEERLSSLRIESKTELESLDP